jgi:hypothetical protein
VNFTHQSIRRGPITIDMTTRNQLVGTALACALLGTVVGCSGRPSLVPNSDPSLRRSSAHFAADAAKRQYHAEVHG